MKIIKVENVSKSFAGRKVLDNVSLTIEQGAICGLIGRNGSGKTVLMKCICGFLTPDSGSIRIRGRLQNRKQDVSGNMGIIIESPGFLENESAYGNLLYLARLRGLIGQTEVKEAIRRVGLSPDDRKKVKKYSMGMRQRLGIAQAIMEKPDILLLDEPMNGLDEQGVTDMRTLFLSLKENGVTILLASHNAEDIALLCDNVYRIDGGKIHI